MRHGPVWGPFNAFWGALFVAVAGRVWERYGDFPLWAPLAVAACGAATATYVGSRRGTPQRNIIFRVLCWAVPAVWVTWIQLMGWSVSAVVILTIACLAGGCLAPLLASVEPSTEPEEPDDDMEVELRRLIIKYGNIRQSEWPTVRKLRDWTPADAGATWVVKAARGSNLGWQRLQDIQLDLSTALDLPVGCPVEAGPAGLDSTQGTSHLKVSTTNYLYKPIDYPRDYSQLTITEEFSVGQHLDASPGLIELHQSSGLVVSMRGGGKTTLLQNITASLVRMPDTIVWHIDLNNGSMSSAWMMATALGMTNVPALDWVAVTAEEALKMVKAAIRIAKRRRAAYAAEMFRNNQTILVPRPGLPAIQIIVDEAAEVTGEQAGKVEQQVSEALQELQRIGRAMLVNVLFSSLRGTGDLIPAPIKKQVGVSFCGKVKDQAELAFVFDWDKGIAVEQLVTKGQFFYQREGGPVRVLKAYRLEPRQIGEICVAVQEYRRVAVLDDKSAQAAGPDYAERHEAEDYTRWLAFLRGEDEEFGQILFGLDTDDDGDSWGDDDFDDSGDDDLSEFVRGAKELGRGAATPTKRPKAAPPSTPEPSGEGDESDRLMDKFLDQLDMLPTISDQERFRRDVNEMPEQAPPPAVPKRGPSARQHAIEDLLDAAGAEGMQPKEIFAVLSAKGIVSDRRQTVNEDLEKMRKAGIVTQENPAVKPADRYGRWWLVRHV
jgi:hypothetical protein